MKTADIMKRLERLEKRAGISVGNSIMIEIEDLRETDISVYGFDILTEIEQTEGRESLASLAEDPKTGEDVKALILEYLKNTKRKGEKQNENSNEKHA